MGGRTRHTGLARNARRFSIAVGWTIHRPSCPGCRYSGEQRRVETCRDEHQSVEKEMGVRHKTYNILCAFTSTGKIDTFRHLSHVGSRSSGTFAQIVSSTGCVATVLYRYAQKPSSILARRPSSVNTVQEGCAVRHTVCVWLHSISPILAPA